MSPNARGRKYQFQQGSTLVAVFWLIGILGLAIFGAARFVALDSDWIISVKGSAYARNLAESGLSIAANPAISAGDPLLTWVDESSDGAVGFETDVSWEEALIPLNDVLFNDRKDIVQRIFQFWGLEREEATAIVDAMVDWVDENDLVSLNGAEADAYDAIGRGGFPLNRPFDSLEEAEFVLGMERVAEVKPAWKEYFTLWSIGQINLNEASEAVLIAATGSNDNERAAEFRRLRLGEDGLKGTEDDRNFSSVAEVLQFFGTQGNADPNLLNVQGVTKRLLSTGRYYGHEIRIAETRRGNAFLWRVEY